MFKSSFKGICIFKNTVGRKLRLLLHYLHQSLVLVVANLKHILVLHLKLWVLLNGKYTPEDWETLLA